ncbi:MAG: EAL domain-containing protein [Magnetococcales bacterium]|nr:EAL domain-containing protein [Magnetococcales bacterium]
MTHRHSARPDRAPPDGSPILPGAQPIPLIPRFPGPPLGPKEREIFRDYTLTSAFQPIFGLAHRGVVGHEALLRVHDRNGRPVSPLDFFALAQNPTASLFADWLTRCLHLRSFVHRDHHENGWIFLNFLPHATRTGQSNHFSFTEELLRLHQLPPNRVVVEILEKNIEDESRILEAVAHYRALGCLIAVDDFGAGQSNFDRIWKLKADIVKLDRSLVVQAAQDSQARDFLSSVSTMLHQAGKLVLLEGVETEEQTLIAMDADVDFVQGFHLARPNAELTPARAAAPLLRELSERLLARERLESDRQTQELNERMKAFLALFKGRRGRNHTDRSDAKLFKKHLQNQNVRRCFVLNEQGIQIGANLEGSDQAYPLKEQFSPLSDAQGADWSRRDYFRRAMRHFGQVQVTGPYFSLPDAHPCVTLSVALRRKDHKIRVYCCDLLWNPAPRPEILPQSRRS